MNIFESVALDIDVSILAEETSKTKVPNKFPSLNNLPYRIAIIGEAPGKDEELQGQPFVGMSGKLLTGLLSKAKIIREACFIGNICQYRPVDNDFTKLTKEQIDEGLSQLTQDLNSFKPHICLLLGRNALQFAANHGNVSDFRGSLFVSDVSGPFLGRKCIASYHPAAVLRQYDWIVYLWFDILKALREATSPELNLPQRDLDVNLTADYTIQRLKELQVVKKMVSIDIEGYWNNLQCCSFAATEAISFIVPFQNLDGTSYWQNEDDEFKVWQAFVYVLTDSSVPKVFQNGLYDRFVLQYGYNIPVLGNVDDTMLKWWEKFCELEKGLGVQASILTNEPYYKFERKSGNREAFFTYCCKDSAVTYECNEKLTSKLDLQQLNHYHLNVALLNPVLYMELRGIRYDKELAQERLKEVNTHIYTYQAKLDELAGVGINYLQSQFQPGNKEGKSNIFEDFQDKEITEERILGKLDKDYIKQMVKATMCYKRNLEQPKKEFAEDFYKVMLILNFPNPLTQQEIGYINIACGWGMNIKSKNFKDYIYNTLNLPKQYAPVTKALTTDYIALLKIQKKQPHHAVELALELGELRTRSQMLEIAADKDGRIRCGYNIVGTETGRLTCYTSPTGSGYNLQTIPAENNLKEKTHPLHCGLRDLFVADIDHYMFQCDLAGADGWTVGAHLRRLGDPTMFDDLLNKLKPAAVICYMLRHGNQSLHGKDRAEIKELLREVKKEDWDYFACKQGIWGTCYLMGPLKLADVILIQSEGKIAMSKSQITDFQQAVFTRYNVRLWHRYTANELSKRPEIRSASGHLRKFWGRSTDVLGQALAHEPQANTTYATNLAAWRLWTDTDNRTESVDSVTNTCRTRQNKGTILRIEPLHQVHDALIGQFKKTDTTWAVEKLKTYFNNEIHIAGIPITIPFEGQYGESWGNLEVGKI